MVSIDLNSYHPPPKVITLDRDEVHVWRAFLDLTKSRIQTLYQSLSSDEQARARRFYFQKDRNHFIIVHGVLRDILSRYLDIQPAQLCFCYSRHGKPALTKESGGDKVRFNLSRSHGLALYAVACSLEMGIDLERIRPDIAEEQIAERFFSPREVSAIRALPENIQKEVFFNCWTRKEAYIKAIGKGLSFPLHLVEVSISPKESAALLSIKGNQREASNWSLRDLIPGPGYTAALVVKGHYWRLKCWQWTG